MTEECKKIIRLFLRGGLEEIWHFQKELDRLQGLLDTLQSFVVSLRDELAPSIGPGQQPTSASPEAAESPLCSCWTDGGPCCYCMDEKPPRNF